MSRPLTLEQVFLANAEKLLSDNTSSYEQRLTVLEAVVAQNGGFEVEEYWQTFGIIVSNPEMIKEVAEMLSNVLMSTMIPISLAVSSLSREPISISEKKKGGVFYTDYRLAQFVAADCRLSLRKNSKIADIAAGSGILLAAVAELYYERYPGNYNQWISENVFAVDLSEYAIRGTRIALSTHASSVDAIRKMCENWLVCDSLFVDSMSFPKFDIVVGNPPWGKIKLSRHSFANKDSSNYHVYGSGYDSFNQEMFLAEKQNTQEYSKALKERYSLLGNAEPDMYMAFLQKAINILKPGGHLSYIVPAGLIRSLGTKPLRSFLIGCSDNLKYYLFNNKANYFEIDTRFKFVVISQDKASIDNAGCSSFMLEICNGAIINADSKGGITFDVDELEAVRPDLTVPECRNNEEKDLFYKIYKNGRPWKEEWSVDITREVDMTNDRSKFHEKQLETDIPVIEGRMVQQFRFGAKAYVSGSGRSAKWVPNVGTVKAQFFISKEDISNQVIERMNMSRAGYCDIAGQTNERAMMSSVIPPGVVCGNKVPTIIFPEDVDQKLLYFFVGVTNSLTFDWVLRRILSTTVNYFLLFSLPMPNIDLTSELAESIISLSKELSRMGEVFYTGEEMGRIRTKLDIAVAKAYGLGFRDLELIIQDFPLLDRKQPPINGETRSTYTRDLLLSTAAEVFGGENNTYSKRVVLAAKKGARAYIPTEMTELSQGGPI